MNKLRFFTNFFSSWALNGSVRRANQCAKHRSRERASWSTYFDWFWEGNTNTRHRLSANSGIAVDTIIAELQRERRGFARQSMIGAAA